MAAVDDRDPAEDYATLVAELGAYSEDLLTKPRLVVANKMDLPGSADHLADFKKRHEVDVIPISCETDEGLEELKELLRLRINTHRAASVPTA